MRINIIKVLNLKEKKKVLLMFIITLITIIVPIKALANSNDFFGNRNLFYIQVMNYAVPAIKVTSFDDEDLAENQFSIKNEVLKVFGIDMSDPVTALTKEASFLSIGDNISGSEQVNEQNFKLDPYKINEAAVSKIDNNSASQNTGNNPTDNTANVYNPALKTATMSSVPQVLIYHTHTTESYPASLQEVQSVLSGQLSAFSMDESRNVCMVGDELANELENDYNINVIHDKTIHDANAYNQSYERSAETLSRYLKKYGDFKIIIDMHRDSVENRNQVVKKINGENVATFRFVMSKDNNPHFAKNMEVVNKLMAISNKLYPGLCRDVYYYNRGKRCFNQTMSNNAVLIEVGTHVTTTAEAKTTAKYLARIIAEYFNGKK